jgi:hypothetical protein
LQQGQFTRHTFEIISQNHQLTPFSFRSILVQQFNKEIHAYCGDIANDINAIVDKCGYAYNDWILEARGRKAFTDHNVELSSANC